MKVPSDKKSEPVQKPEPDQKSDNSPPPLPPPPGPMMFGQKKTVTNKPAAEDPLKLVKREINALNRILVDTSTLILSSEDQKKYNPESGFCRNNGREIELSSLKHIVFWTQGADHIHTITGEQMKSLIKACNENNQASGMLGMSISSVTQNLEQNKITLQEAQTELANLKRLKDKLMATHKDLMDTMKKVRENNISSGLSKGPKEGVPEYPDLKYLFDNFVFDSKIGFNNGHRMRGENTTDQFFNYLMSAAHQMLGGIKVVDDEVAFKARTFIDALGGPDIFRSMAYYGNTNDSKSKYGLVKDKDFKTLIHQAEEALKESKKMRHKI